jgi:exopolysaccharide biosynthesis protein
MNGNRLIRSLLNCASAGGSSFLVFLVLAMAVLFSPLSVQAQGDDPCPINPFFGGRQLYTEGIKGDRIYIVCIDLDLPFLRFETVMANDILDVNPSRDQRETVAAMVQREPHAVHEPIVAINADYFGAGHGAEGLTVVNGKRIDGPDNGDCDNRQFQDCRDNATYRASLSISRLNNVEISHKGATEVANEIVQLSRFFTSVGGGPLLIQNGEVISDPCSVPGENVTGHNCSDTQQTAIGLSKDGKTLIIVVAESRTGQQVAEILKRHGAFTALKVDGGGSSQLWFEGDLIYYDPEEGKEGRPIANALLIFREKIPRHDSFIINQSEFPVVAPGGIVNLAFELQNTGFLTWDQKLPYSIRFIGGDRLGLSNFYPLEGSVPPGAHIQWSQSFSAPTKPGTYQTIWQMTYEDINGNVEAIGPKVGYIVTVLPEGSSLDLSEIVNQLIDQARREAGETVEEFLARLEAEINRRIDEELKKITICGQPILSLVVLGLVLGKRKQKRY